MKGPVPPSDGFCLLGTSKNQKLDSEICCFCLCLGYFDIEKFRVFNRSVFRGYLLSDVGL